jgi:hypothetical protein
VLPYLKRALFLSNVYPTLCYKKEVASNKTLSLEVEFILLLEES